MRNQHNRHIDAYYAYERIEEIAPELLSSLEQIELLLNKASSMEQSITGNMNLADTNVIDYLREYRQNLVRSQDCLKELQLMMCHLREENEELIKEREGYGRTVKTPVSIGEII